MGVHVRREAELVDLYKELWLFTRLTASPIQSKTSLNKQVDEPTTSKYGNFFKTNPSASLFRGGA